jgi:hypothetical protein
MTRLFLASLLMPLCATAACTDDGVDLDRVARYELPLESFVACRDGDDCSSDLDLCADGTSYIVFTDVLNNGTWSVDGDLIQTRWRQGDAPARLRFEIVDDERLRDERGRTWFRSARPPQFCR